MTIRSLLRVLAASAAGLGLSLGCTSLFVPNDGTGSDTDGDSLTAGEQSAVEAFLASIQSINSAVNTTQGTTSGTNESSLDAPSTCPTASFSASNESGFELAVSMDFGESGCNVLGSEDYVCSGNASGLFSQAAHTMDIEFNNLSCDGTTLSGDVTLGFNRTETAVALNGEFDLVLTDSSGSIATQGEGVVSFDLESLSTTISTFDGTVTQGTSTFLAELEGIQLSFTQYDNFVPFAGTATLSSSEIRTMTIEFDADSPTTGVVQVTVAGGEPFSVNIFEL